MQYDLSETDLARFLDSVRVPTEGELAAVMAALMIVEDCAYVDLARDRTLVLTSQNRQRVAEILETQLQPMARDIGRGHPLRTRLDQLTGLRISAV